MNKHGMRTPHIRRRDCTVGKPLALLVLLVLVPWSYCQTAPAAQPSPAPTAPATNIRSNVDEVSLDLVVHDKRSKLVLDLKPTDLAVSDNESPVKLRSLHLVTADSNAGHLITMVFDPMEGPAAKSAQEIAKKVLKMAPKTGFSFAALTLGRRLRLVQEFTDDRKLIEQAVDIATQEGEVQQGFVIAAAEKRLIAESQAGVNPSGTHVSVKDRAMAQTLLAAIEGSQRIVQDQNARPSLAGLLALAQSQQKMVDRKSVIYFTLNGQMDSDAKEIVNAIMGAANRSGVSLYIVDINGMGADVHGQLMTMMVMGNIAGRNPIGTPVRGQAGDPAGPGAGTFVANNSTRFEGEGGATKNASPLAALAAGTGGTYIDGQDSVKKPLERMLQDMTTYYQATYAPPIEDYDGKFRSIDIKPLRTGLEIRSKTGYFALPPGGGEGIRPFEAPLLKILSESELPTELHFNASVLRLGDLPDGNTCSVVVEAPLSELEMHEDTHTNLFSAHVSIMAQIIDKNGTVIEHFGEDMTRHGSLAAIEKARADAFTLQRHFIAAPGAYVLEVAILDRTSGKAAAQRVNFEIPESPAGPSLSDLVLVRQVEAFRAETDPLEPLRYETAKVTPNLTGRVPAAANAVSLYFILHSDPQASDPAKLDMEVLRNGKSAAHMPLPLRLGAGVAAVPYLATFQASALAPGLYEVKTTVTQGGKTATRNLSFTVEGSQTVGAAADTDAQVTTPGLDAIPAGQFVISVPTDPVPPPAQDELQAMIADARQRAISYADSLPNFMCLRVTNRSLDSAGSGQWKHKDTLVELLRYRDKTETPTLLRVDGKPSSGDSEGVKGTRSVGEFGGVLNAVFDPASKAILQWKQTARMGSGTVQIFDYKVVHENSNFKVTGAGDEQITVGFHGQVFIDSATRSVRRVTLVADDLPRTFSVHATSVGVDYDYVVLNAHDYLMPVGAQVSLRQGRRAIVLNLIEFRDYKRFGSNLKILGFTPVDTPE